MFCICCLHGWQIAFRKSRSFRLEKINERYFEFYLPANMRKIPVRGVDSYIGEYQNELIKLSFDYGMYSGPLDEHSPISVKINGQKAKLASYTDSESRFIMAIYFPKCDPKGKSKLAMSCICKTEKEYDVVKNLQQHSFS